MASKEEAEEKAKKPPAPSVSFLRLFSYADSFDYVLMLVGCLGAIVHGAGLPVFVLFFGELIDTIGSATDASKLRKDVNKYSLYMAILGVCVSIGAYFEVACWMTTGERQASRIRSRYLRATLRQDVAYFDTESSTGEIVARITSDMILVEDAIGEKVGHWVNYMAVFVTGFVVGFSVMWKLALVVLGIIPFIAFAGGLLAYVLTGLSSKEKKAYATAGSIAEQNISNVRTVYSFTGDKSAVDSYSTALIQTVKIGIQVGFAKGWGLGLTWSILQFSWALLFYVAALFIAGGDGNGGKVLTTAFAVIFGGLGLGQSFPMLQAFALGKVAAFKIFETIARTPAIDVDDPSGLKLATLRGEIELRDVKFTYPARPEAPIFRSLSLSIPAGTTMALVGTSGSGKSTVVALIERWYDPEAGAVLIDGVDIKQLQLRWLRQHVALVGQEPVLFATTIRENILYGRPDATDTEIVAAAKAANIHSFINELPMRYETQTGERGVQLSGGQKQRIAIARAMIKNPAILLLDEATSALDVESERVVQEALDRIMVGRTTVIIAHRLSTVRNVDAIAVVSEGKVVELGKHEELLAKGETGAYASLVRLQNLAKQEENNPGPDIASPGPKVRSLQGSNFGSRDGGGSKRLSMTSGLGLAGSEGEAAATAEKEIAPAPPGSFYRLAKMNSGEWPFFVLGIIGAIGAAVTNPAFGLLQIEIVNRFYQYGRPGSYGKMKDEVRTLCFVFMGLGVYTLLAYMLLHYSFGVVNERLVKKVRERMFAAIMRNEVGWFDREENSSGILTARLSTDATQVRSAIGDRIATGVQNVALIIIATSIGLYYSWRLGLVILSTYPLLVFGGMAENIMMQGFAANSQEAHLQASTVASEAVSNIRTVAAFCAEDKVVQLHDRYLLGPMRQAFKRGQIAGAGFGFAQMCIFGCMALSLWYAGKLVADGNGNFASVMKAFMVLVLTAFAMADVFALVPDLAKGSKAVASAFQILDRPSEIDPADESGTVLQKVEGRLELQNVEFRYPSRPDIPIFTSFSLTVPPATTVALVGASGSGKSSVISLIERFYDPIRGSVLVDGQDIRKLNLRWWRQQIGLVQQEPALFAMTIRQNILYGRPGASEAEVIEAARAANAHNFISALPAGYETEVGERGVQLSGGQKQRVAIARAVLKSPAILLLDEATSALDAESERIVQEALDRIMVGRTTVIVAHRLSTIRGAGIIAVVQEGKILEQGSHNELIDKPNGAYAALVNLQQKTSSTAT